jgi:hypothetical protein
MSDLIGETGIHRLGSEIRKIPNGFFQNLQLAGLLTKLLDQPVASDLVQPSARVFRQSLLRPGGERSHARGLDRVFHELDMPHAHPARQHGDQPAVIVPEEVLHQAWRFQWLAISRTSTLDPGVITPGLSLATSSARS